MKWYYPLLRFICHQDWIRVGLRSRLLRTLAPFNSSGFEFTTSFYGGKYSGNSAKHIDYQVYFFGAYELPELKLFAELAETRNQVVLDVGGNVGHHALFFSRVFEQVHSFEPYAPVRQELVKKSDLNGLSNIAIHAFGLGNKDELLTYFPGDASNDGKGTFVPESGNHQSSGELEIRNGDNFLRTENVAHVDCIKIDVEGFERATIEGLSEILVRDKPRVMFEFGKRTKATFSNSDDLKHCFPNGYRYFRILGKRTILVFFNLPGYRLIQFDFMKTGGNILAIHKDDLFLKTHASRFQE